MDTFAGDTAGVTGSGVPKGASAPGERRPHGAAAPSVISFTIPGQAVPWARAGGGRSVVRFTPKKQRNFMALIKDLGSRAMRGRPPIEGPVELSVLFVYQRPKSHTKSRCAAPGAEWKASKPDGGNLQKIVEDALNTIAWRDDAQVASWHGWKRYGDVPRVVVKIRTLGEGTGGAAAA